MGTLEGEPKDRSAMREDVDTWLSRLAALKEVDLPALVKIQTDHVLDLCTATGYTKKIANFCVLFEELFRARQDDVLTMRDHCFTSIYTGAKAPKPVRPWLEKFDDSVETFLQQ